MWISEFFYGMGESIRERERERERGGEVVGGREREREKGDGERERDSVPSLQWCLHLSAELVSS